MDRQRLEGSGERLGPDLICPRTGERYHEIEPNRLVAEP
jgi:hypothetical protein